MKPDGQKLSHVTPPSVDTLPSGHCVHAAEPAPAGVKKPVPFTDAHVLHDADPDDAATLPGGHALQPIAPVFVANVPTGHAKQAPRPLMFEKLPGEHEAHDDDPARANVPGPHKFTHCVWLDCPFHVPAGHREHSAAPAFEKNPAAHDEQSVAPARANLPAAQVEHCVDVGAMTPGKSVRLTLADAGMVPLPHVKHSAALVEPTGEDVPTGHAVGWPALDPAYVPGGVA